jgi:hypothetical protein
MVIKSGTNNVHGNGFTTGATTTWRRRRGPTAGGKKAEFNRKIFGGTVAADRPEQGVLLRRLPGRAPKSPPADSFVTVIRTSGGAADLSSSLARATPIVVRDPNTGQPFPNNQIPSNASAPRPQTAGQRRLPATQRRLLGRLRQNYVGKVASSQDEPVRRQGDGTRRPTTGLRYSKQTHEATPTRRSHVVRLAVREPVLEHGR